MEVLAIFLLIIVLVILYPWLQQRREDALARRLESVRDPAEAAMMVDGALRQSRDEGSFLGNLRDRWLPTEMGFGRLSVRLNVGVSRQAVPPAARDRAERARRRAQSEQT